MSIVPCPRAAYSTDSFASMAQKSPRLIKLQYCCQRGSNTVNTTDVDSNSPALSGLLDKQPSAKNTNHNQNDKCLLIPHTGRKQTHITSIILVYSAGRGLPGPMRSEARMSISAESWNATRTAWPKKSALLALLDVCMIFRNWFRMEL